MFSTPLCPHCKTKVHAKATRCPHCQGEIAAAQKDYSSCITGFLVIIVGGVVMLLLIGLSIAGG